MSLPTCAGGTRCPVCCGSGRRTGTGHRRDKRASTADSFSRQHLCAILFQFFFTTAHSLHCLESPLTPLGRSEDAPSATRFRRICALYIVPARLKGTSIMETRQAGWLQWRRPICVSWGHVAAMIAQGAHNDGHQNMALKDEKRRKRSLACTACAANRFFAARVSRHKTARSSRQLNA